MHRVWAPFAKEVILESASDSVALVRVAHGWWEPSDSTIIEGDYAFRVDGKAPLPDPRSQWQPSGVTGSSRKVDHAAFPWTDRHWQAKPLSASIIYELHIGTFTPEGTFESAIARLPHLVDLGVTHIELMPVCEFLGNWGWGYDGVFAFAPHHRYGSPNDLKRLVDACHAHGLGVILDVVYNHLGPSGNCLAQYGPYFTDRHKTPWGDAINFDGPYCDEVRRYFCDSALMWLRDYHFDGLRLDAVHAIVDTSAFPFLEQLATEVDALQASLGRHLTLIAESDLNDPRVVRPQELGGFGFHAQWSDDIHHALHTVLTTEREGYYADFGSLQDLATSMVRPFVYAGRHSHVRQRSHGRPAIGLKASRFVAFLQNHDQLGNRARGERICHLVNVRRVKIGAALILLSPYVPMLFQGEEWGASAPFQYFVDFATEPQLAQAVIAGRAKEFGSFGWNPADLPDPTRREAFERSKLHWEEIDQPPHNDLLTWHRRLIALRSRVSDLTDGQLDLVEASFDEEENWLRVDRGSVSIVCNFALVSRDIPLRAGKHQLLLASSTHVHLRDQTLQLDAESVAILQR